MAAKIGISMSVLAAFGFLFAWVIVVIAAIMAGVDGDNAQALWLGLAAVLQLITAGAMLVKKLARA